MKNLSIASVIEKNKLTSSQAWLVALKIHVIDPQTYTEVETLHLVRNDEEVSITTSDGTETYAPMPFDLTVDEEAGQVPSLTVSIKDQSRTVQAKMQEYRGGVGFGVEVMVVRATHTMSVYEPDLHEHFSVVGSSANDYVVSWQLGAENPLSIMFPRGSQLRDRCRWRYKSPECKYVGSLPTCSRVLIGPNGCQAHNNTPNYGGLPGIVVRQ